MGNCVKKNKVYDEHIINNPFLRYHFVSYELYSTTNDLLNTIDRNSELYYKVYNFFNTFIIAPDIFSYKIENDDPILWKIVFEFWRQSTL